MNLSNCKRIVIVRQWKQIVGKFYGNKFAIYLFGCLLKHAVSQKIQIKFIIYKWKLYKINNNKFKSKVKHMQSRTIN